MSTATRFPCPHCGETNHLGRALLHPSGLHLRCRGCRRSLRLVDSVSGIFMPILALGLVYGAGFWLLTAIWPPASWTGPIWPVVIAALPFLAAVPAGWWTLVLALSGRDEDEDQDAVPGTSLSRPAFLAIYLTAILTTVGLVLVLAFGALLSHDIDPVDVPRPTLPEDPAQVVVEGLADWSAVELDGTERRLGDLVGRPALLCLWGPGDPLLVPTLKGIQRLRRHVDEAWFVIVAEGPESAARAFIAERGPRLPYCLETRPLPPALEELRDEPGPSVFLLDSQGRVAAWHSGAANWDQQAVKLFFDRLR